MTALNIFEELRFILELIIAEQIFVTQFASKKKNYLRNQVIGFGILIVLSIIFTHYKHNAINSDFKVVFIMFYYIFMCFLTLIHIKLTYKITYSDTLFIGISGYTLQHIEFVLINEILAIGIWPELIDHLLLYIIICIVTTGILYYAVFCVFSKKMEGFSGVLYEDSIGAITYFSILIIILFMSSFMGQHVFANGRRDYLEVNYIGALTDVVSCTLILFVQYGMYHISSLNHEKELVKGLLYERKKQYEMTKENIDIINLKCHDLKHQIQSLRLAKSDEIEEYINEVERSIIFYDAVVKTENEVLNTILSEKSLYCEKHGIKLSCIVEACQLDFMGTTDIYALLGNALDNAIESVNKITDKEKRVISLTISAKNNFLSIQTNNFYKGELKIKDGLPVTSKNNRTIHGFGMKSMKTIVEKYSGALYTDIANEIFTLSIVLPIPIEFTRLLNESKNKNDK